MSGKASDMKNGINTYIQTNYVVPKVIIIDIPRVSKNHISIAGIESIKNMFFFSGKYEGGMVSGPNPHVVAFANVPPPYEDMSADKWHIMDLQDDDPKFIPFEL